MSDIENQAEKDLKGDPQLEQDAEKEAEKDVGGQAKDFQQDAKKDL